MFEEDLAHLHVLADPLAPSTIHYFSPAAHDLEGNEITIELINDLSAIELHIYENHTFSLTLDTSKIHASDNGTHYVTVRLKDDNSSLPVNSYAVEIEV